MATTQNAQSKLPPTMKAEKTAFIEPGHHRGTIVRFSYEQRGEQKFPYLDVIIRENESGVELKAGYPANRVTTSSSIGRLLDRFGFDIEAAAEAEQDVDWTVLKGDVEFDTETEETAKGKFARVLIDSVTPVKATPAANKRR